MLNNYPLPKKKNSLIFKNKNSFLSKESSTAKIYENNNNNKVRIKIPTREKFLGGLRQSCIKIRLIFIIKLNDLF
jgi:hypothetical protein